MKTKEWEDLIQGIEDGDTGIRNVRTGLHTGLKISVVITVSGIIWWLI